MDGECVSWNGNSYPSGVVVGNWEGGFSPGFLIFKLRALCVSSSFLLASS